MTFNRLTAKYIGDDYISPKDKKHKAQWWCECACKNPELVLVSANNLKRGKVKSCGCLHQEKSKLNGKNNKKYNTYILTGEYGIGYTVNREEFYFDLEDYDLIKNHCWNINEGYVTTTDSNHHILQMHRLIMHIDNPEIQVDHIYHIHYDNRKEKLRIVIHSKNMMNRGLFSNNTTGVTGVSWNKRSSKWQSYIGVNNKLIHLGLFDEFEDAVFARKIAEEKYFKEYSYDNSMRYQKEKNNE